MKKAELFHPRIFDEQEWAEGYYKRNAQNISRVGKRFAGILKNNGVSDERILDVGCGFAAIPIEIARSFPDVEITGIDLGNPLLEIGWSLVDKAGLNERITLITGDAQNLEFENHAFDIVINSFMLHIVEQPVLMLNEIERVSKPGAKIMITDLRRGLLAFVINKFRTAYTSEEAMEIIHKSDLRAGEPSTGPFWWDYMAGF